MVSREKARNTFLRFQLVPCDKHQVFRRPHFSLDMHILKLKIFESSLSHTHTDQRQQTMSLFGLIMFGSLLEVGLMRASHSDVHINESFEFPKFELDLCLENLRRRRPPFYVPLEGTKQLIISLTSASLHFV